MGVGRQFRVWLQPRRYSLAEIGRQRHGFRSPVVPGIYLLLCIFNGFAFA